MRTFKTTACFFAAFLLVAATPAQAWWGWLDDLSGPGPFWGQQLEFRVACFKAPVDTTTKDLADQLFAAKVWTHRIGANRDREAITQAVGAWHAFAKTLEGAHALRTSDIAALKLSLSAFESLYPPEVRATTSTPSNVPETMQAPAGSNLVDSTSAALIEKASLLVLQSYKANVSINSTGMFWSFCSPTRTRRWALETGLTFWQANSRPEFAHDYTVRLITLMPSVSYRVFKNPAYDVVDVGAGAGIYWFSSRGFDTFHGLLVQPARVDLHAPTQWVNAGGIKGGLGLITLRAALMGFPAGFDAGAFAGVGDKAKAIPGEIRPTLSIFFNVAPLLRRPPNVR